MIFYFSGTGNSKWAAEQIAVLTGDDTLDITKINEMPNVQNEKQIGLVFPVYAWGIPEPMLAFVNKLDKITAFTFAVCTCGQEAGKAMKKLSKIYSLDSGYSLIMPNNYIIGADVDDDQTIRHKLDAACEKIKTISCDILEKKKSWCVQEGAFAGMKSGLINFGFNRFARSTKSFYATNSCNACGLCVKNCPASTISLVNGKPVWDRKCYQCLRCINECPQKAIQYGKATESRGRYTIHFFEDDASQVCRNPRSQA